MMSGGAMAQIQSPSQTGPGGPPLTGAQPPSNAPAPRGSANSATMTRNSGQAMHSRSGHSSGEARRARTTRQSRMNESDRAYMGGGMILENGRPVDMPMGSSMGGSSMGGAGMGGSAPGMRGSTMGPDRMGGPSGGTAGMRSDPGTGPGMGRPMDPAGMGSAVMPGGTGTGRGAGASASGG
jgi:hypothetical protein